MVNIKRIDLQMEGVTPILMNSPRGMLEPEEGARIRTKKYDQKEEAEKVAYRNAKGKLYVPSAAVKGMLINAASFKKAGKFALRPLIAGSVRILDEELVLDNQKYEVDLRTVVIQRARVVKARPKVFPWKLDVSLEFDSDMISDPNIIMSCFEDGGRRVGILDFRPQKLGEFGQFKINKWKVAK